MEGYYEYQVVPSEKEAAMYDFAPPDYLLKQIVTPPSSIQDITCPQQAQPYYNLKTFDEEGLPPEKTGLLSDVFVPYAQSGFTESVKSTGVISEAKVPEIMASSYSVPYPQSSGVITEAKVPVESFLSPEEVVFQGLEMVIRKMSKTTRICFRDALNRLAKQSRQQYGEFDMIVPSLSTSSSHDTLRSGGMYITESTTNLLDKTIADLMFNELICDQPYLSSVTSASLSNQVVATTNESFYDYRDQNSFKVPTFRI